MYFNFFILNKKINIRLQIDRSFENVGMTYNNIFQNCDINNYLFERY